MADEQTEEFETATGNPESASLSTPDPADKPSPSSARAEPIYSEWIKGDLPSNAVLLEGGYQVGDHVYVVRATADAPARWYVERTGQLPPFEPDVQFEASRIPPFFYPVVREFTGLVQTRIGAGAEFDTGALGRKRAGEVFSVGSRAFAERLVYGGLHAHVDPNTPLGVPEALQPKAKE